jgi:dipeptidyl aminopeptidase/acylaminoacyl peptidase
VSETNHPRPEDHRSRNEAIGIGSGQTQRRLRRWLGGLLVSAALLAVALTIIVPRLDTAPAGGRLGDTTPPTQATASRSVGGLLYVRSGAPPTISDIWIANPDGTGQRDLTPDRAADAEPDWSPDGRRIVYASMPARCQKPGCQYDLYAIGRDGKSRIRLTKTPQDERDPDWSPDGSRIAYIRWGDDGPRVWAMRADGTGQRRLTDDPGLAPDWSPDGKRLLYLHVGISNRPLYTINADGSARQRLGNINVVRFARWSPDGTSIALSAHDAIWIVNADGGGLHRIRQSGAYPSWSPDSRHLLFVAYAASPAGGPSFAGWTPTVATRSYLPVTRATVHQSCARRRAAQAAAWDRGGFS